MGTAPARKDSPDQRTERKRPKDSEHVRKLPGPLSARFFSVTSITLCDRGSSHGWDHLFAQREILLVFAEAIHPVSGGAGRYFV